MGRRRAAVTAALALRRRARRRGARSHRVRRPPRTRGVGRRRRPALARSPDRSTSTHRARSRTRSWRRPTSPRRRTARCRGRRPCRPASPTVEVISGISEAVSADFAPDGTAFIALKTGVDQVLQLQQHHADAGRRPPTSPTSARNVNNYWDRGLTGIAVDPQFGTAAPTSTSTTPTTTTRATTRRVVPKWGDPARRTTTARRPPTETNPRIAGCVVQDRVTRLTAVKPAPTG